MPQPLLWKASWIRFTFFPSQPNTVIHDFLTDFGPYDFKRKDAGMSVKFTDPLTEEDFVRNGARKARMEIADGITLKIQRPQKDPELYLVNFSLKDKVECVFKSQLRTQIAHEAATAISQDPDTLDAMGEFFKGKKSVGHSSFKSKEKQ